MVKIKGFKGFDKDLKCRGFQYEVGRDYMQSGVIRRCDSGFHFCEHPLRVFEYYKPSDSRYCEVEGEGKMDKDDSKVAVSHIHIGKELGLNEMVNAAVKLIIEKAKGDYSAATNTGNCSVATNTGNDSAATVSGKDSVAIVTGKGCKAAGAIGCWLVLTERDKKMCIVGMKAVIVDGIQIKAGVYYSLKSGEIIEVD